MQVSKLYQADCGSGCGIGLDLGVHKVQEIVILKILGFRLQDSVSIALRGVKSIPITVAVTKFNLATVLR